MNYQKDEYGRYWYDMTGRFHREDGPALITKDGNHWCKHGVKHRVDGPASIWEDGEIDWWIEGVVFNLVELSHD